MGKSIKYFTASWCQPCAQFRPIMTEIKDEGHDIEIIDVDECDEVIMENYNIEHVPTSVVEEDGLEVERFEGSLSREEVLDKIL